jgi:hypothetical protein
LIREKEKATIAFYSFVDDTAPGKAWLERNEECKSTKFTKFY